MTSTSLSYVPREILRLEINSTAKLLLLLISSMQKGLFMTVEETSRTLDISRSSIYRAKEFLLSQGLILKKVNDLGRDAFYPVWEKIQEMYKMAVEKTKIGKQTEFNLALTTTNFDYSMKKEESSNMMIGKFNKQSHTYETLQDTNNNFDLSFLDKFLEEQEIQTTKPNYQINYQINYQHIESISSSYITYNRKLYKFELISTGWVMAIENLGHELKDCIPLAEVSNDLLATLIELGLKNIKKTDTQNQISENKIQTTASDKTLDKKLESSKSYIYSEAEICNALRNYYKHTAITAEQYSTVAKEVFDFYTAEGRNFKTGKITLTMTDLCKKAYSWIKKHGFLQNKQQQNIAHTTIAQQPELKAKQPPLINTQVLQAKQDDTLKNNKNEMVVEAEQQPKDQLMADILRITNMKPQNLLKSKGGKELLEIAGFNITELLQSA